MSVTAPVQKAKTADLWLTIPRFTRLTLTFQKQDCGIVEAVLYEKWFKKVTRNC